MSTLTSETINVDLIYWENGASRRMSACTADWLSTEFDAKGAVSLLAKEVTEKFPSVFASVKDAETFLMVQHFKNMICGTNSFGLFYPTVIGSSGTQSTPGSKS